MRLAFASLLALALIAPSRAQTPGSCALGEASATLDANDVAATVFNTGSLFFGHSGLALYEVPKDAGLSPIFAAGLWVGGRVGGDVRVVAARYSNFQLWPGPLEEGATLPNPADCSAYDHIWTVSRDDVRRYLATGEAAADLASWPVALGAPVLDGDGDPQNYDLAAGDQPDIQGEQAAFWVMNDVGNVKTGAVSAPMGLEVQAYAFAGASPDGVVRPAPDQTTYYRFRLVNRNTQPIEDAYVTFFSDPDLGDATDDYVGTDTTFGMGIVYNADEFDGTATGYGSPPPAFGFVVVEGPVGLPNGRDDDGDGTVDEPGERLSLTASSYMIGGGAPQMIDPATAPHYYNRMQGRWNDGAPMREGGDGLSNPGGAVTTFAFPGDPVRGRFWSEENTGAGPNTPGDRRFMVSAGPFRLDPGEADEVTFALVFAPGTVNRLSAIENLREGADRARRYIGVQTGFTTLPEPAPPSAPPPPDGLALRAPRPNPFSGAATVGYEVPAPMRVRLALYDALGREVAVLADGVVEAGVYEAAIGERLPAGTYLLRLEAGNAARAVVVTKRR